MLRPFRCGSDPRNRRGCKAWAGKRRGPCRLRQRSGPDGRRTSTRQPVLMRTAALATGGGGRARRGCPSQPGDALGAQTGSCEPREISPGPEPGRLRRGQARASRAHFPSTDPASASRGAGAALRRSPGGSGASTSRRGGFWAALALGTRGRCLLGKLLGDALVLLPD